VLAIDKEKRQLRLSVKQLAPSSLDEYLAEHQQGDLVTGRIIELSGENARVELGEGIQAAFRISAPAAKHEEANSAAAPDLSALTSMLSARWKGGASSGGSKGEEIRTGQVRSFRIARLDPVAKKIELELA
jgi:small subunit ribosomal protein S1